MLRKLAGQTAVYGISSIVARLLNYLLTPYLTRIMSPDTYGVVTDMYAVIPFALVVLTMGMETGYFKFAGAAVGEEQKRRVFSTTWAAVSYMGVIFMSMVLLFNDSLAQFTGYADHPSFIWIVGAIIALDVISAIPFARLRQQARAVRFVVVRTVSVVVNLLLCLFFYSVLPLLAPQSEFFASIYDPNFGAGYVFVANLVASAVTLLMLLPSCEGVVPRIDWALFKKIVLYSLPLLVSGIAGTANEFIDRQMIKYLMPDDVAMSALGIYGAVVKIGVVMLMFTQMYRFAAEPFFLSGFSKDNFVKINAQALKYYIVVSVALFLFIALFVDIFALIIGRDFREGIYILPVVLLANILAGVVFNLSFWYKHAGRTEYAILVAVTGLVVTVGLNVVLIPWLGYLGAAWARLVCELTMVGLSYYLNRRFFPTPYDLPRIGEYLLVGAALYGAGLLVSGLPDIWKYIINLLLCTTFVIYVVWREKINVRKLLKI